MSHIYGVHISTSSQLSRQLKAEEYSLRNRLRSITDDRDFVEQVCCGQYSRLPVFANLRCGVWYLSQRVLEKACNPCYFKSTDGHVHHWKFSITRLNAQLIREMIDRRCASEDGSGERGGASGAIIVDSTRKGKRFPDSFSRTIPIWCCVWNRAIQQFRQLQAKTQEPTSSSADGNVAMQPTADSKIPWDTDLHMPSWVSAMECSQIEERLPGFVATLLNSGIDLAPFAAGLIKPLRCLWMDRTSHGWANGDADFHTLSFTPLLLVQCSRVESETRGIGQRQGWSYIQGAGDDEENWINTAGIKGFTPDILTRHWRELSLLDYDEDLVERVREIIEEESRRAASASTASSSSAAKPAAAAVELHAIQPLKVFAHISNSIPAYEQVTQVIQAKDSVPPSAINDPSSSTSSTPAAALSLLYLHFDATSSLKQQRRLKLAKDQERKIQQQLDRERDTDDDSEDNYYQDGASISAEAAKPEVDWNGWPETQRLSISISSQAKCKHALLDILSSSVRYLHGQRASDRTTIVVCSDVNYISCVCAAAMVKAARSDAAVAAPTASSAQPVTVDKNSIRASLNALKLCLPDHFPPRLLLKQLNQYLLPHGVDFGD